MSKQECICPIQKRVEKDGEIICSLCGIILEEKQVEQTPVSKTDENGNTQRHHEMGLGTDVNETASVDLKRYTRNHAVKITGNKHVNYALERLRFFIKSNTQFQNLSSMLETEIRQEILLFIRAKKKAGERIEENKVPRKVGKRIENKIRYYAIDNIIEKTIIEFCFKNPNFGINVNSNALELHNSPRHSKNGVKTGTNRGSYRESYYGLKELSCMKHGRFDEKSNRQHYFQIHQKSEKENISYTTYLEQYIKGYKEWKQNLKFNRKNILVQPKNNLGKILTCSKCGLKIKHRTKYNYYTSKNGKKIKYTYQKEKHVLEIDENKFEFSSCAKAEKAIKSFNMKTV